jgi:L-lysine 2,3-aminomutase
MSTPIHVPELPEPELSQVKPIRGRFEKEGVLNALRNFYPEEQIRAMQEKGVDTRMVFGINSYYMAIIKGEGVADAAGNEILPPMPPSIPLQHLVVPVVAEAADVSGEKDPSNQIRYSPEELKGKILHKYDEIVLGYVAMACSAHCRYCYRLDLFNGSTGKGLIKAEELRDYVINYNKELAARGGVDAETGEKRWPITEILLSGGDAMVLSNKLLYKYMAAGAEAGVDVVRIGTKEMAFRPMRFDTSLVEMLKIFHTNYPNTHVNFVTHFSHPDEFLERNADNSYRRDDKGHYVWLKPVKQALENVSQLDFVSLDNQTPVIKNVNDSVEALHLLHRELRHGGISFKYIFQCREIEGHKAFAVPVEESWRLNNESQKGISDGGRSTLAMSTEWGKLEVTSVTGGYEDLAKADLPKEAAAIAGALFGEGLIIMRVHRSPFAANTQGDIVIARRNPNALWISDYEDRIIYDGRKTGAEKYAPLLKLLGGQVSLDQKPAKAA